MHMLKKVFMAIFKFFKAIKDWIDYQEIKIPSEIGGLFLALICAAVLFFLPSYDPGYNMTPEKFTTLCENNGFEMADISDTAFYVQSLMEDTHDDYTLKYYSCNRPCYAKFYHAQAVNQFRTRGGYERNVYNYEFQLTTFTANDHSTTIYRNGTELLVISGPKSDSATLEKILKKCRIPDV